MKLTKLAPNNLPSHGFTLLELIVAAAIFSIALLVATGLFVSITRGQKRVQSLSKVQDDARFVLEQMTQSVRLEGIDYSYYRDPNGDGDHSDRLTLSTPAQELVTKNADGTRTFYRWIPSAAPTKLAVCTQAPSDAGTKCQPDSAFTDVTPKTITITDFKAYIRPFSDPFALPPRTGSDCLTAANFVPTKGICTCTVPTDCFDDQSCASGLCLNPNLQPRATLLIASKGGSAKPEEQVTLTFQTTVSSRLYKR